MLGRVKAEPNREALPLWEVLLWMRAQFRTLLCAMGKIHPMDLGASRAAVGSGIEGPARLGKGRGEEEQNTTKSPVKALF